MFARVSRLTLFAALALVSTPAPAQPGDEITVFAVRQIGDRRVIEVPYQDLDLSRPAQVDILRLRVDTAARQGCSIGLYQPTLTPNEQRGCIEDAIGGAAPQLKRAQKRAWEIARTGHSSIPAVAIAVAAGF